MTIKPIVHESLADEVYRRLRELIFQNSYKSGERLDIDDLAQKLDISRQPVVEAVSRLAREGLLVVRPRVGTFVRQLSSEDVHNIMGARLMIELFAMTHGDPQPAEIQALYEHVERMDAIVHQEQFSYLSYNEQDVRFHQTLVKLAHNPLILQLYQGLHADYVTVRAFYGRALERTLAHYGQHRQIARLIESGDRHSAATVLEKHIGDAEREIQGLFKQLGTAVL